MPFSQLKSNPYSMICCVKKYEQCLSGRFYLRKKYVKALKFNQNFKFFWQFHSFCNYIPWVKIGINVKFKGIKKANLNPGIQQS
jgi:hypothetical protein